MSKLFNYSLKRKLRHTDVFIFKFSQFKTIPFRKEVWVYLMKSNINFRNKNI